MKHRMMEASKMLYEIVGDVTECPICTEVIVDSKVLPCIHTFCLKCLEQFWKDKKPGDSVPCLLCRTEFNIPAGGLSELPRNYFVEKLLEAKPCSREESSNKTCDICSRLKHDKDEVPSPATKYCVDCQNGMCEQCANVHLLMKGSEQHRMVEKFQEMKLSMKYSTRQCDLHKDKKIELYCLDCNAALCTTCFINTHNGHACSDINDVCDELKKQIQTNSEKTNALFLIVDEQSRSLEIISRSLTQDSLETETQIIRRGEEMKKLVDEHVQSLLKELNDEITKKGEELEIIKEMLTVQKLSLESLTKYSQKVLDSADSSDIAYLAPDLISRANNLTKMKTIQIVKKINISFIPSDISMLSEMNSAKNIIGEVSIGGILASWNLNSSSAVGIQNATLVSNRNSPVGITLSDKEIFTAHRDPPEILVFDCESLALMRKFQVPGLKDPWDITLSQNVLFVGEYSSGLIHRVPLNSSSFEPVTSMLVFGKQLSLSTLKSSSILVTCFSLNVLIEFAITGQQMRTIFLPQNITNPTHAIQMDNDRFLVSHVDSLNRVCLIDNKGGLIKSYGGARGSMPGQVGYPYHLVADGRGNCLVVEHGSANRVLMLNLELEFVKEIIPKSVGLLYPLRLCLDQYRKRLFVADYNNSRIVSFDFLQ